MRSVRVAVGVNSKGELYGEHFGDSDFFLIYELKEDGTITFLERRKNDAKDFDDKEQGTTEKFKSLAKLLNDVQVFVAGRMGPNYLRVKESGRVPIVVGRKTVEEALEIVKSKASELISSVGVE